jgi:16S rRNA (guanine966-N2)-methyltransferase
LYSGSGALGFEAASRGAKSVVLVENNIQACRCLKDNVVALNANSINTVQSDVLRYLGGDAHLFDVVFLDPPFGMGLIVQTCRQLEENGWLAKQAKIYVETERHFDFLGMPENWRQLKSKTAGEVGYHLFERIGSPLPSS